MSVLLKINEGVSKLIKVVVVNDVDVVVVVVGVVGLSGPEPWLILRCCCSSAQHSTLQS